MDKTFTPGLRPWEKRKPYNRPAGEGKTHPLWWLAPPPFPRKRGHNNPCLMQSNFLKQMFTGALLSHRFCGGKVVPQGTKGGKAAGGGSFPPTGIYYGLSHMLRVPRSFAALRMTVGGGKEIPYRRLLPQVAILHRIAKSGKVGP